MEKEETFHDGLTVWTFFDKTKEVGVMKFSLYHTNANIFSIEAYQKGYGAKMINHLKSMIGIETIDGDVSEGTGPFCCSVGAIIKDGELLIRC